MIERLALISCFTTHLLVTAAFSELNGTLSCTDCKDCGPVTGTIELWEHDIISSDDFQDKKPIIDGKYTKLCFNEFEWTSTSPYFLIKHSCSPTFWLKNKRIPEKLNCYVETKYSFDEPSSRENIIDLDLLKDGESKVVCEQ